ncbi:MAG TPA: ABC transporter transmembrane domain-containing protein, partial [Flavisolibacter sp.]|nr:ABC transporter transmembrane domain-containing protein [Flavisolibacter sp.]
MKILVQYLKPQKFLVFLVLFLAALNIGFSLVDPIIFGKIIDLATRYAQNNEAYQPFFWGFAGPVLALLGASIGVAMISRIAKNFQDYFLNVIQQKFGAKVFTDGLKHAMRLPYQEFEDQRSGETLSILQKVRTDTEKFVNGFVNILFTVLIGIIFVAVFAARIHWSLPFIYFGGIALLMMISNLLSVKVKT